MPDHIEIPPLVQATAGATGSIVSNTIVYPLDLVLTRVQTSRTKAASPSTFNSLHEIFKSKGIRGLYQGLGTDNLSSAVSRRGTEAITTPPPPADTRLIPFACDV